MQRATVLSLVPCEVKRGRKSAGLSLGETTHLLELGAIAATAAAKARG